MMQNKYEEVVEFILSESYSKDEVAVVDDRIHFSSLIIHGIVWRLQCNDRFIATKRSPNNRVAESPFCLVQAMLSFTDGSFIACRILVGRASDEKVMG